MKIDLGERVSASQQRSRAIRLRALAAEATTARAKEFLLAMARQSEGLAGDRVDEQPLSSADDAQHRASRLGVRR